MNAHIVSTWLKAAVSLFFVVLLLPLPNKLEVFKYLYAFDTRNDELEKQDALTQKREDAKLADSIDNKVENVSSFRLIKNKQVPIKLETIITRFQGDYSTSDGTLRPVSVDLIAAIHFAEPSYYEKLNQIFSEYDVVVFEMVTPKGTDVRNLIREEQKVKPSDGKSILNIVPFVQQSLADALGFCYQIDGIDYGESNLIRGDADIEEFIQRLLSNNDLGNFCVSSLVGVLLNDANGEIEGMIFALLCAKDRRLTARRLLALNLERSGVDEFKSFNPDETILESSSDDALIAFRNQKALATVRRELNKGRTKLAIFYGAAHLPDFARRLERDFGMKQTSKTRWIPAWNMEKK